MRKNAQTAVTDSLSDMLADSYVLYLKTQNYHWNVTGAHFSSLHALFQQQYEDLATALDDIAERIRALGAFAPGSFSAFAARAKVGEETGQPDWKAMVKTLVADQDRLVETAQTALKEAQDTGDEATADLMIQRIAQHQKNRWMLQAHLA